MKRFALAAAVAISLLHSGALTAAEGDLVTITGTVVLVKVASRQILVAYKKPGALIESISTFKIDEKTKFKNAGSLTELKINDAVRLEYAEAAPGDRTAQMIEKQAPNAEAAPAPTAQS